MDSSSVRIVPCPQCGGPSRYEAANRYRPFCSERCRERDLGRWAAEDYRVADSGPAQGAPTGQPDD